MIAIGTALLLFATTASVTLTTDVEEGKPMIIATVTRDGKPVEGAKVSVFVARAFGRLPLGTEATLDDGTAAVPFPHDLAGSASGNLEISADATLGKETVSARATLTGARKAMPEPEAFPRELWSPQAPVGLLGTIFILGFGVWAAYAYVFMQLRTIRKGGPS